MKRDWTTTLSIVLAAVCLTLLVSDKLLQPDKDRYTVTKIRDAIVVRTDNHTGELVFFHGITGKVITTSAAELAKYYPELAGVHNGVQAGP